MKKKIAIGNTILAWIILGIYIKKKNNNNK